MGFKSVLNFNCYQTGWFKSPCRFYGTCNVLVSKWKVSLNNCNTLLRIPYYGQYLSTATTQYPVIKFTEQFVQLPRKICQETNIQICIHVDIHCSRPTGRWDALHWTDLVLVIKKSKRSCRNYIICFVK